MKKLIKGVLCALLIISLQLPCFASYIAYMNKTAYVYQRPSVSSKRVRLKKNTKVYIIGTKSIFYVVYNSKKNKKGYVLKQNISRKQTKQPTTSTGSGWKAKVVKMEWFGAGKNVVKAGHYAELYLIGTDQRIKIKRTGGLNHMDIEPADAAQTEILYKMANYQWSWTTYPVILIVDNKYIAASINLNPHGRQTLSDNNFSGHFCLHLVGSKTHGTKKVNKKHQDTINEAYKWAH